MSRDLRPYNQALVDAVEALADGVVFCDRDVEIVYCTPALRPVLTGEAASEQLFAVLGDAVDGIGRHLELDRGELLDHPVRVTGIPAEGAGGMAVVSDSSNTGISDKVLSDFVANVSHELKTPIGALGLLAETLATEEDPDVAARLVQRLQVESIRVSRVVDDLLNLSRLEGATNEERQVLPADVMLSAAISRVIYAAEHRKVRICVGGDRTAPLFGHRTEVISALQHLLENGIKYSNPGTTIEVDVSSRDGWTDIAVTDHGMGISPKYLDRIFERFYRVDDARTRSTGGTGLGLSLVKYVAESHGGDVYVTSEEGVGSTFTLRLAADPSTARNSTDGGVHDSER